MIDKDTAENEADAPAGRVAGATVLAPGPDGRDATLFDADAWVAMAARRIADGLEWPPSPSAVISNDPIEPVAQLLETAELDSRETIEVRDEDVAAAVGVDDDWQTETHSTGSDADTMAPESPTAEPQSRELVSKEPELPEPETQELDETKTEAVTALSPPVPLAGYDHAVLVADRETDQQLPGAIAGDTRTKGTGSGSPDETADTGRVREEMPVRPVERVLERPRQNRIEAAASRKPKAPVSLRHYAGKAVRAAGYVLGGYLAAVLILIGLYRFINPPTSTLIAYHWLAGHDVRQTWVPIEKISPQLIRAVVISEDWRFCEHKGVDLEAIEEAIEKAGDGLPRGASTISMQVTKNLFLSQSKSYVRKAIEIPLTLAADFVWPKSRMLEIYLNIAEWGPGVFGAEAAAQHHFAKSARGLGEREAALLAASLPNPMIRDAGDPGPRTARKASIIQSRMRQAGPVAGCVMADIREARTGKDAALEPNKRTGAALGL